MNKLQKLGISVVALSLAFGLTHSGVVEAKSSKGQEHGNNHGQQKKESMRFFTDVQDDNWALKAIIKMAGKGVFVGDQFGFFQPTKPITRAEAVVAAVRLMGMEADAKALTEVELHFKDAKEIDKKFHWAENYIYVGLEHGLFDSNMDSFQPEKPATREWVATLLVRALGLTDEANAKMNTSLSFKDARAISASAVGYVAVAVEKGLVTGYQDGTFQPNKPITRSEMAALLDRTDWENDDVVAGVKGSISAISADGSQIEVTKTSGEVVKVTIGADTYLYLDGKPITKDQIKSGYLVTVVFKEDGQPLLIDLKSNVTVPQDSITGTLTNIVLPTASTTGTLSVLVGNETKSFTITSFTKVLAGEVQLTLTDLALNQKLTFKANNNIVTEIKVEGVVQQQTGVLKAVYSPTSTSLGLLVLTTSQGDVSIPLSSQVQFVFDNKVIGINDLVVGSQIEVTTFNNYASKVVVKQVNTTEVKGSIQNLVLPTATQQGILEVKVGTQTTSYLINTNTVVKSGDLALNFSDLAVNQNITAKVENQTVKEMNIAGQVASTEGKVMAVQAPAQNQIGYITVNKDSSNLAFQLAQDFTVLYNGTTVDLTKVEVNDVVNIKSFNNKVKVIEIKSKYTNPITLSEGVLVGITLPQNNTLGSINIIINNQLYTIQFAADVAVFDKAGNATTLASLQLGNLVGIEQNGDLITKITVKN